LLFHIVWSARVDGDIDIEAPSEADALAEFDNTVIYDKELTGKDVNAYNIDETGRYAWEE